MKKIFIALLLVAAAGNAMGQNLEEYFNQKRLQTRYLVFQLTALRVHNGHLTKGNEIAKEGLGKIGKSTKADYRSHERYFRSQNEVSPAVRNHSTVNETVRIYHQTTDYCRITLTHLNRSGFLSSSELSYLNRVYDRVLDDCRQLIALLRELTTDYRLEMSDAERIENISAIHLQMKDNYAFSQRFGNEAKMLIIAREREKNQTEHLRVVHGVKP